MSGQTISTSETRIEAFNLQSSCYGGVIPMCWGVCQVSGNVIWYGGFKAIAATTSQGGKGGVKQQNTTYTYQADVLMGIANTRVSSITRIWKGKSLYSGGITPSQLVTVSQAWTTPSSGAMTLTVTHASAFASWGGITRQYTMPDGTLETIPLQLGTDYTQVAGTVTVVNAALHGVSLQVTYQYTSSTPVTTALDDLGLTLVPGDIGQAAWSGLASYGTQSLGYSGMALVAGQAYPLGTDASIENHKFETVNAWAYHLGPTVPDVDPSLVLRDVLSSARGGANFPATSLDGWADWSDYCCANNLLVSPAMTEQAAASQIVDQLTKLTNSAVVWSGARLKIIPYGDSSAAANGRTFTPDTTPIYDLDDTCWTPSASGGEGSPLSYEVKLQADRFNHFRVEYLDRSQQYAVAIAEARDLTDISVNGLVSADIVQAHWICDGGTAKHVAQLLLQRSLYVLTTYKAPLPWHFALLEGMDLVTITDAELEMDHVPVRITAVTENEEGDLTIEAEDYPPGVASATLYPHQLPLGYQHDYNVAPGTALAPIIFEAPAAKTNTGIALRVAVNSSGNPSWGGAQVWISLDGSNYRMADIVYGAARSGTVATAATGSSTSFAVHNLTGQLLSGSATDAENLATLCYIGGASPEYFAYQSASLTGPGAYTLAGLERQAYGTPAGAHAVGDVFVRVDDSVAQYEDLDVSMIGMVIYVKVCSFNIYGQAQQGLADVSATTYTVTGNMAQYLLGIGGKGITVDATALAVNVSGTPSPASITLTAHHKGLLQGSVVWTIVGGSIAAGGATSPTPDTCVVDTSAILSYPLTVRASITDAVATYLDDTTIVSVVDGDSAFLLIGDANMRVAGNTASKVATSSAWDSQAYSADAYIGGAAMSMTPLLVCNVFAGLNADPLADADFPSIDYGIYAENTGKVFLFTSGTNLGQFGTWGVGDILGVAYDNASVKFTKNGSPLHTVVAAAGLKLYLDSTFHDAGAAARFTFVPAGAVGGAGADAPLLTLSLTQQTFTYDGSDAATPSSQTITASAILQNVTGVAAFTCTLYDAAGSSLGTVAMGGSGNTRTLTNAQFAAAQWAVIVASLGGLSDTETIVRLRDGQNSIVADLTNQAQTLPADVLGHVSDYTGASTQMTVYRGLVDDSANWTFSRSNSSGVTSSLSGNTLTVTALADINDTGYVDITAARTGFVSITKRFTLSKSKGALVSSGLASLGNFAVSGYTVLQTHACTVQFKFSSTGFIAKREGQAETSSLTESSTKWSQSTPPSVGYKIQVGPAVGGSPHNTTGSGTLSGLGSMLTLDSTHSVTVGLVITNGICDAYVPYTIYDSTGTTQLASGNISLEAESTN